MKKRSEVAALRKRSEVTKPSAEARTVPLPLASGTVHCDACDEDIDRATVITSGDKHECPSCGATLDNFSTDEGKPADKPAAAKPADDANAPVPDPENKWCSECGTEVTFNPNGSFFSFPCGHGKAERIDDPRKAKRVNPAAGLQTRTFVEIESRNAEDAKKADASKRTPAPARETSTFNASAPTPSITIEGERISVMWGKSTFPLAMMSNFTVGEYFVSVVLPPGADRVKAAREILADIEKIANEAFDRQRAWYEKKLGSLQE